MELDRCNFKQAVKKLADLNNINIDNWDEREVYRNKLDRFVTKASRYADIIQRKERDKETGGNVFRDEDELDDYIMLPECCGVGRRGISPETQIDFNIRMGRIKSDPYKHLRIIIPIHDENGKYIAVAGRTWYKVSRSKYWYDPAGLAKNLFVFNLHRAKRHVFDNGEIKPTLFVCEGSFDVLKLHQMGYGNSVAIFGANPTVEQFRLMTAVAGRLVLCLDDDEAGVRATKTMLKLVADNASDIEIMIFPIPVGFKDVGNMDDQQIEESMMSLMKPEDWLKRTRHRIDLN